MDKRAVRMMLNSVALFLLPMSSSIVQADSEGLKDSEVEVVTVTATKLKLNVFDFPGALDVIQTENVPDNEFISVSDIAKVVSGFSVVDTGPTTPDLLFMRGINFDGIGSNDLGGDSYSVASYVNSIPMQGYYVPPQFLLKDLDRVEILKGPQSTQYGASSLSGLIVYHTSRANPYETFSEVAASLASTRYSGDLSTDTDIVINTPIVEDRSALRALFSYREQGGFVDNNQPSVNQEDINNEISKVGRVSFFSDIGESATVDFMVHQQVDSVGDRQADNVLVASEYQSTAGVLQPMDSDLLLVEAHVGYELNDENYLDVSINHYNLDREQTIDVSGLWNSFGINGLAVEHSTVDVDQNSFEARLTHDNEVIKGNIGVFFSENDLSVWLNHDGSETDLALNSLYSATQAQLLRDAALFGEAAYGIADSLSFTLGGRYFTYRDEAESCFLSDVDTCYSEEVKDEHVSFKAAISYSLSKQYFSYISVSEGFRRGGANPGIPEDLAEYRTYEPDTSLNYEVGLKTLSRGGDLKSTLAIYYIDWDDVQLYSSQYSADLDDVVYFFNNTGNAESYGIELGLDYRLNQSWLLAADYSYTKAQLAETHLSYNDSDGLGDNAYKGDLLPGTPQNTFSFSLMWTYPAETNLISAKLSTSYVGEVTTQLNEEHLGYRKLKSYSLVDGFIDLQWEALKVGMFIRNLLDKRAVTGARDSVWYGEQHAFEYINRPRTVGVEVKIKL